MCCALRSTEQSTFRGEKGRKSAEKMRGRGVASKGGKKEKRTRENRSACTFLCVPVCVTVCPSCSPHDPAHTVGLNNRIPPAPVHDLSPPFPHPYLQAIARPTPGKNYPSKSARKTIRKCRREILKRRERGLNIFQTRFGWFFGSFFRVLQAIFRVDLKLSSVAISFYPLKSARSMVAFAA